MVQSQDRIISTDAERYLLLYTIAVIIVVSAMVILFFVVFQRRKNKLLEERYREHQEFQEELSKSQMEIQEQTLKDIGQELHDNVGQLLALAHLQINMLLSKISENHKKELTDSKEVVKQSLDEVRSLSKSLNQEVIKYKGFEQSLKAVVERLNRTNRIKATLNVNGQPQALKNGKHNIILFRILQEFLSNTMKYSKANNVTVKLTYSSEKLEIYATDDGTGFNLQSVEKGSGLLNMESRAKLIQTQYNFKSIPGQGTALYLCYPFQKEKR
ncbi:sensor histidine kinase [Mangrovimonas aestuarii]|uniref:sensor histidine kinase n=1 Tax=Mangrovimonas aestuarii TaxID=3018443 RepID=UPI002378FFDB|nr:histidine kinase [Mangrovimonas aestuarii]